ncbi:heparan sulfate 2-O-sulfotransferase 1-like [Littorina saxatilis]|uniref:heparan sulfate 2-O-sulfotransferase 1-like n=1 Tax=Littorina saxatilis TaxID=31220 RepID=UPI0038B5D2AB
MIPPRQVTFGLLGITVFISLICLHLLTELSQLDGARQKLERAVVRLQEEKLPMSSRHLSSSNDQEGAEFGDDDSVVIYNRVPKTGSTTLAGIMYSLCNTNKYFVIHIGMFHSAKTISLSDQMRFLHNITTWQEKKPALYHGHIAFIDYSKFGVKRKPIFINMVRDPLARLISFYYFTRNGDDIRPSRERQKDRTMETFDECVERDGDDCDPVNLWLQIPYFCGHIAECWIPGSEWALNKAKQNVLRHYLLVGLTEEMEDFITVLEAVLPRFFKGALTLYKNGNSHLRKTAQKLPPKPETISKIHESPIWQMENDFYEFVRDHFHYIKDQLFETDEFGRSVERGHRFQYEKIRPS